MYDNAWTLLRERGPPFTLTWPAATCRFDAVARLQRRRCRPGHNASGPARAVPLCRHRPSKQDLPGYDPMTLRRVRVRGSDPIEFFAAKMNGRLLPERAHLPVAAGKRFGVRA